MSALPASQRERLLRHSAVANDGLWFYQVLKACGADEANRMNAEVVLGFSRLEMVRLLRALGASEVASLEEFLPIFRIAAELFVEGLFECEAEVEGGAFRLRVTKCFAYEGVKRAGVAELYRCGPGQRLRGWLEAAGLGATIGPAPGPCQMARCGSCAYTITP
jgi:hypothetical protein